MIRDSVRRTRGSVVIAMNFESVVRAWDVMLIVALEY